MNNFIAFRAIQKARRYILWRNHLKKYDQSKWYFVLKYGLGDAYLICSLLKKFVPIHGEFVLIFEKENQLSIPSFFFREHSSYYDNKIPYDLIKEFGKQIKGMPIVLHPIELNAQICQLIGYNKITLLDIYKILLDVDIFTKPNNNLIPGKKLTIADYNNSVLLCPQANSVATLDISFWIKLAELIKANGYLPIFLRTENLESYKSIDFPIQDTISICNNFHGIVSLRSGFCDLISTCDTKKMIIYPHIQWRAGKLIDSTSLALMGLCLNDDKLLEIELYENQIDSVYEEILNFI